MTAPHQESVAMVANPGETLRTARESKGWSLASVAQQLNLSERSLTQIEAGDFSQLPGHTFARGYVRAYAKLLGLDQNRLVQEFDQHTGTDASGSSVISLGRIEEPGRLSRSVMRLFGFALLVIIAGASWYWWQERSQRAESAPGVTALERIEVETADGTTQIHMLDRAEEQASEDGGPVTEGGDELPLSTDEPSETAITSQAEDAPSEVTAPAEDSETLPVEDPVSTITAPPASAPTAPETSELLAASPAESANSPAAGEARLVLQYSADCWTRVTDVDGRVLYSALAKAGSERIVTGKAPLDVHLGYARGAQVSYNGDAVNLAPYTRGETARLKLGQ
ncbi:helix-turn-helix domain-containing protein [Stutzerimonas stutzeri]|uniref:RodZ domain-containing protein n=1 Tax=Stutzerimonas sp. S1 TaxID=3030652 RepID=UPI0022243A4B|nr:RodZ family helix-turn-helix domain-containing protein [Stutzerimonas sp. S1]MCW3148560.1 helix-turn-helix domain-containing protein [Stutzerimonas sp. S1]